VPQGLAALTDAQAVTAAHAAEASRAAAAGTDGVGGAAAAEAAAAAAAAVEKLRTEEAAERAALEGSLRAAATAAAAHAGRVEGELKAHVAAAAEAAEATASDVDALRARAAEAEGEIGRAAAEAAKALHRADSAGVSRHELSDLNEKLVRLKDGAAELHARKYAIRAALTHTHHLARTPPTSLTPHDRPSTPRPPRCDKRALAELAQTLSSAFKGEMSGLERALARAVDDAVAGEVGGLRMAVDELRGEKEGGKKDAEVCSQLQHRLPAPAPLPHLPLPSHLCRTSLVRRSRRRSRRSRGGSPARPSAAMCSRCSEGWPRSSRAAATRSASCGFGTRCSKCAPARPPASPSP
jgi:hypothetical protein